MEKARGPLVYGAIAIVCVLAFFLAYTIAPAASVGSDTAQVAEVMPEALLRVPDTDAAQATRIRTCDLAAGAFPASKGQLTAAVATHDGEHLWGFGQDELNAPASVLKLLTVLAGWRVLGPDFQLRTKVVGGIDPGEVWLVGGGDATLTRAPGANYYDAPGSLQDLAAQVVAENASRGGPPITTVYLDISRYQGFPEWNDTWRKGATGLGFVAPITSLQVDGDRDDPMGRLSPRSNDPAGRAGAWFAQALAEAGNPGIPDVVVGGVAPVGSQVWGEVSSAPLSVLIGPVLRESDNTLAEIIAREVALALDTRDFGDAIRRGLGDGIAGVSGVTIVDGSGLSPDNRVSVATSLAALTEMARTPELSGIIDALAVSGERGSLRDRFGASDVVDPGGVEAKTGSITGTRSLAGYVEAADGTTVVFSVALTGRAVDDGSRDDLDRLVEALAVCGENLAHWSEIDTGEVEPGEGP